LNWCYVRDEALSSVTLPTIGYDVRRHASFVGCSTLNLKSLLSSVTSVTLPTIGYDVRRHASFVGGAQL
jgi:hypothetical protein